MKPIAFAIATILSLLQTVYGDVYTAKKCLCASDTLVGYHSMHHIKGLTTGFGDTAGVYQLTGDALRDDISHPRKEGFLCAPNTTRTDCKRVPDASQYFNKLAGVPRKPGTNCFTLSEREVCSTTYGLKIDGGVTKRLPGGKLTSMNNDECAAQCRSLWPNDESTFPLCEVTERDSRSEWYGKRVLAGNGYWPEDADRCFEWKTDEFDFNKLGRA